MWLVSLKRHWNLIGCFVLLSHSHWLRKRCDLEQKIVRFLNKSHRWEPIARITSDSKMDLIKRATLHHIRLVRGLFGDRMKNRIYVALGHVCGTRVCAYRRVPSYVGSVYWYVIKRCLRKWPAYYRMCLYALVCSRMYPLVTRMYSHVTHMYSYVTRMYSHVTHMYLFVTRM